MALDSLRGAHWIPVGLTIIAAAVLSTQASFTALQI